MSYIPYAYDNLMYGVILGIGILIGIGTTINAVLCKRPTTWFRRRLFGLSVGIVFVLVFYTLHVLLRQADESAASTRPTSQRKQASHHTD